MWINLFKQKVAVADTTQKSVSQMRNGVPNAFYLFILKSIGAHIKGLRKFKKHTATTHDNHQININFIKFVSTEKKEFC